MSSDKRLSRVLLTNDDGFDAPGLAVLAEVAAQLADEVWIVAPQQDQSGMAQSVTLNGPLRCVKRAERQWAVSGTPSDCVVLALSHLMEETPPSLVLSGVNAGANTGDDVNLSGTLGAAYTAVMLGVPAIGLSIRRAKRQHIRWDTARAVLPATLGKLLDLGWHRDHCLSINLPDLPADKVGELTWVRPAHKTVCAFTVEQREDLREKDYFWLYPHSNKTGAVEGTDLAALDKGLITVASLSLDRYVTPQHLAKDEAA